ncbi:MAG: pseudaminic acid synthase [Telmatospirillum sp.]|nr:pseudaminic acid synthase [Telmatospirillum sp.]
MSSAFEIGGRAIGGGAKPYVIAEMSGNHNGDIGRALKLIDAAKEAGADAVKLQTYTADTITLDCDGPGFVIEGGLWNGRRLYDLYREAHTPWEWHPRLFAHARAIGIHCFSSPFDETAVDFLESLDAPAYKIASFEIVHLPLIRRVAATGKPTIISTGMASPEEIAEAVDAFRAAGGKAAALLHCTSAYPAPAADANLRYMPNLGLRTGCPFGLSDHTIGNQTAIAAIALGACIVEKHFTLARADGGPDSAFSLEPAELRDLVESVRVAFDSLGSGSSERGASEQGSFAFRRSIYATRDIAPGERFSAANVRIVRPGYGLAPRNWERVVASRAAIAIKRGAPIDAAMLLADEKTENQ